MSLFVHATSLPKQEVRDVYDRTGTEAVTEHTIHLASPENTIRIQFVTRQGNLKSNKTIYQEQWARSSFNESKRG